jgi:hypothetical protein
MKHASRLLQLLIVALGCFSFHMVHAQATPTATQTLRLQAFAGPTGTDTGLASGHNLGITAGIDVGSLSVLSLEPFIEFRGTYAINKGGVDSQKNVLAGVKLAKAYGRLHPYGDALFGRGQINYKNGFPDPMHHFAYFQSFSNILSFGGGIDVSLSEHLQFKVDAQIQRYSSPVTDSGRLYSKPLTIGIVYRFTSRHIAVRR